MVGRAMLGGGGFRSGGGGIGLGGGEVLGVVPQPV